MFCSSDTYRLKQFLSDFREREQLLKSMCRDLDVSWIPLRIMVELYSTESHTLQIRQLRDFLSIDSSNVRSAVLGLEEKNYVQVSKNGKFGVVSLTETGKLRMESIDDFSFLRKCFNHKFV